ncbi:MAG TPA: AmmeMemoRadiSam system protein A [Ignavibacteriales bacterium]|nr:AmmeMemoRadiSam system protein A [Ignavibacteriales bacterium]HOL80382.1 AmmeMemoRadiSam system protein A [Ignavibacteriales bacterium]HOM64833.1 AmmeMemoRadiSam system protein A [Ignavibacteriales bacterium]HPD67434.1 AmmeMemoRadiSam system protein A [Ignavibacteriales bacterium]HRT97952.1 AmmeMemoRadiSam system protein A [Ignavibacteriales bacterium]
MLGKKQMDVLLSIARNSIKSVFENKKIKLDNKELDELGLNDIKTGAFVTLHLNGELRGCIGFIETNEPLPITVSKAAQLAAFNDYRFEPLSLDEFDKIKIEISVLSKPFKAKSYDEIEIGKHGLIVDEFGRKGLLLPQVATEWNMTHDEFLSAVCRKAGLDSNLWRKKFINLYLFTVEYFSE